MELGELLASSEIARITMSAIMGGIAFKIVERFINSKYYVNEQLTLRLELRKEMEVLRAQVHLLQKEVDDWRDKYYHQLNATMLLQSELQTLRADLDEYRSSSGPHHTQ